MECVDFCTKNIAVVFNEGVKNPYPVLQKLEQILIEKGTAPKIMEIKEMKFGFDFVFAVGETVLYCTFQSFTQCLKLLYWALI